MSDTTLAAPLAGVAEGRIVSTARLRGLGTFLLLLAVVLILGFGLSVKGSLRATFTMTDAPAVHVPPVAMPVQAICVALGVLCAVLGLVLLSGRLRRGTYVLFGLGILAFLWAFLTWAARGNTLDFPYVLSEAIIYATPLVYGSLSGIMCERSGVVNIAIEGQFLGGAFLGELVGSAAHNLWLGVLAGAFCGALFGALLAFLALRYGADQIIVGVVIVAFATGLTNFLTEQVLSYHQNLNAGNTFNPVAIPGLDKIPIIGSALFDQNVFIYGAIVLLAVIQVALFRTRWGLRVRAVGEHPRAAATVGIHVKGVRYRNVILGGVIAGIGGAYFTIGSNGAFAADMTAGLGYVALAAMIFGRWRPLGALSAALLFGFAESLQAFLAVLNVHIPSPFLSMAPYVITIAVVSGLVGRVRPPAADGVPYVAE
ncbi:MAG TPA: ABC transporter permease [Acidimicrobiales bacterium]|nr:ABC transporter permease [Acidimicrobiales bacterium]